MAELSGRLRPGANVTGGGQETDDIDGHGTAVASVAAAQAGGVRGISTSSPIIPVKVFDARGETSAAWVIAGIKRAIDLGAGVINLSAAGPADQADPAADRAVQDAVDEAVSRGIPVVTPTGNEGSSSLDIPAAYPHVIAVGATDQDNLRAMFSNGGPGIDLAAPGDVLATAAPAALCPSGYGIVSGTSFAAPAVAGAAALLLQAHPGLDVAQLTDLLRLHGGSPAWSSGLGFGLLDVPAALAAPVPPADTPEVNDTIAWANRHPFVLTPSKRSVTIRARIATHSDPVDVYRVRFKKGDAVQLAKPAATAAGTQLAVALLDSKRRLAGSGKFRVKRGGTYYVRVSVVRTPPAGSSYSLTIKRRAR